MQVTQAVRQRQGGTARIIIRSGQLTAFYCYAYAMQVETSIAATDGQVYDFCGCADAARFKVCPLHGRALAAGHVHDRTGDFRSLVGAVTRDPLCRSLLNTENRWALRTTRI